MPRPVRVFLFTVLWVLLPGAVAHAGAPGDPGSAKEGRARAELEAELEALVGQRPKSALEIRYQGTDPRYQLEKATFFLDGVQIGAFEGDAARKLAGRVHANTSLAPGVHVLESRLVVKEVEKGFFDLGLSLSVTSHLTFRTEGGLRLRLGLRAVEQNPEGKADRIRLASEALIEVMEPVEPPPAVATAEPQVPVRIHKLEGAAAPDSSVSPPAVAKVAAPPPRAPDAGVSIAEAAPTRPAKRARKPEFGGLSDPRLRARLLLGAPESPVEPNAAPTRRGRPKSQKKSPSDNGG